MYYVFYLYLFCNMPRYLFSLNRFGGGGGGIFIRNVRGFNVSGPDFQITSINIITLFLVAYI